MAKTLTVYLAADLKKFNSGMDQAGNKVNGFSTSLKDKLGPALMVAAAAAGAFALKLAKDGVQAAIEDEKAVAQLANTLSNLNLAHDTTNVEAYIYQLERAYGVADTDLRPAYERLVRSTKDTEEANRALKIAMDISASTGKSLQTVVDTLGRAYDGSTTSLSRLGVGLDQTQLAAMNVNDIMTVLAQNFAGSADRAANTFEGRLGRLRTATDNLAEAFGAGLLDSLNDATNGTQSAVDAMEKLEPALRNVGKAIGDNVSDVAYLAGLMSELGDNVSATTDNMGPFGSAVNGVLGNLTASPLRILTDAIRELRGEVETFVSWGGGDFPEAQNRANESVIAANKYYRDAALRQRRLNEETQETTDTTNSYTRSVGGGGGGAIEAVEALTDAQEELLKTGTAATLIFDANTEALLNQIGVVQEAQRAIDDYATSMQTNLLGGIDLGAIYTENFDEQGRQTGKSLVDAFQEQINQAEWFGNVLTAIKAQGADQSLIEQIASLGPEVGGALGQQLLNEGIIPTLNAQWLGVQETTRELALGLVPEFLYAAEQSEIGFLNTLIQGFQDDQIKLKKLGKQIGKQVGASFKQQIAKDVADAVRQVEAAATAARAEAVAKAEAQQARLTEQAVAQALGRLITNSDQRAGRDVTPVLG